jgi:tetraacyldisaccharide 4'-kinase
VLEFLRILFSPLVVVYSAVIKIRNYFFNSGIFKITKVNAKVISVGNLTVGGSGKTPAVLMIAEFLKRKQFKTGILSRGYGRSSHGYIYVSDGSKINTSVDECGDEIYFLSEELKIPAAVCERRVEGAEKLIKDSSVEFIILDDAFQHRWINRDLDIVIIDQRFLNKVGQIEQKLLPLGLMRENFDALDRADIVIINRKFAEKKDIPAKLKEYFDNKKIFTGYYAAKGFYDVKSHNFFDVKDFRGQKSLVVCGVARPHSFLHGLEINNIDIANKLLYPDHKNYTLQEVQGIRKKFYDTNSYSVLTTQKDAVKLGKYSKEFDDIDIYYLKIELKLDEQKKFEELILNKII